MYIRDYFSMFICAFILSFFVSFVFACPILIIILLIPNFLIFCYLKKKQRQHDAKVDAENYSKYIDSNKSN